MEMKACVACVVSSFSGDWKGPFPPEPGPEPKPEYISTDGRTPVDHYIRGGIECIDAMKAISTPAEFQAFCRLTAFKYLWRLGEKDNPAREAKKANDYTRWLEQSLNEELQKDQYDIAVSMHPEMTEEEFESTRTALHKLKSENPETD